MKKSIAWDLGVKPLSVDSLSNAQMNLSVESKDTSLSMVSVTGHDLQLIKDALHLYYKVNKEMRDLKLAIDGVHAGNKLIYDKLDKGSEVRA